MATRNYPACASRRWCVPRPCRKGPCERSARRQAPHRGQPPIAIRGGGGLKGLGPGDGDECVERRLARLDALQIRAHELHARKFLRAEPDGELGKAIPVTHYSITLGTR